jgi:DNA repair protein RecO (recombination protein O)
VLHKTRGIVFHQIKYSETSIIAKIYTEVHGLQSYLVKGVRQRKSSIKAAYFQPLTLLDLVVQHKEKKDLQYIKEIKPAFHFKSIQTDVIKSTVAIFINEILYKSIKEEESNQKLFDFLYHAIQILDITDTLISNFHLIFMIQFSKYLGFFPKNNYSDSNKYFNLQDGEFQSAITDSMIFMNESLSTFLNHLLAKNFEEHAKININKNIREELTIKLLQYYEMHVSGFGKTKSLPILAEVLKK